MKKLLLFAVVALVLFSVGCDTSTAPSGQVFFPTNHWNVKSVIEGEVVVEAVGTNLKEQFRVVKATPMSPLTNGQPVRVELTVAYGAYYRPKFISARAYPSID